jgi:hypothetical protein
MVEFTKSRVKSQGARVTALLPDAMMIARALAGVIRRRRECFHFNPHPHQRSIENYGLG